MDVQVVRFHSVDNKNAPPGIPQNVLTAPEGPLYWESAGKTSWYEVVATDESGVLDGDLPVGSRKGKPGLYVTLSDGRDIRVD
jgi:hypothetical protein